MHNLLEIYNARCIITLPVHQLVQYQCGYSAVSMVRIKRIYEKSSLEDGCRILVDRVWPRGFTRRRAKVDLWLKEIAPSDELRKWFAHDPVKWVEFMRRYFRELEDRQEALSQITTKIKEGQVTLLYGAKDKEINNAVVLQEFICAKLRRWV